MDQTWFYDSRPPVAGLLELDETAARHAVQVLRMVAGDQLCITDGIGNLHFASIAHTSKKSCTVSITQTQQISRQTNRKVAIGISPLKNVGRFEWFLEKATELGVAEIFPIICKRTIGQASRWQRLETICISAMLQSQQTWLPVLHKPIKLESFLQVHPTANIEEYHHKWIAHCAPMEKHHLSQVLKPNMHQSLILIGPEGDFTQEEIFLAEKASFHPVSLGNTRLRTETAGMVAASLMCLLP